MSKAELFHELTNLIDIDPFALLGISVSADEKRIAKRYRHIAKQLHPDALNSKANDPSADETLDPPSAAQIIARIVNPSYQKLKHENGRQEMLSTLRFRVRRLVNTEKLVPTFPTAQQLAETAEDNVNVFYEQCLTQIAQSQFHSLHNLQTHSLEIGQLNLIFLRRKMENLVIRPKRTGLIVNPTAPIAAGKILFSAPRSEQLSNGGLPTMSATSQTDDAVSAINYVQKHSDRAKTYLSQQNYEKAIQELREALKLSPQSPELHSMIGQAYYKQKLSGMAKTHFRQALKLNPSHQVAQKYSKILGILDEEPLPSSSSQSTEETPKKPWLGRLLNR
ncbi:MAG: tetratricopeptide repeat protein [Phormidesmis sp. RL_2_1]|nr:tetratricopeptide repeat protein [Phormidesmis sp. RL_2_1]